MDFTNPTKDVFKRIHPSGAETCVKTVDSISKEKSTVFISSSAGCPLKCKFCHLTIKGHKYSPLTKEEIIDNTLDTIFFAEQYNPSIRNKKLKLSWMGMGDAMFNIDIVDEVSQGILHNSILRLDKIDLSTAMPKSVDEAEMDWLNKLQINYREHFRVFWSLFSVNKATKQYMMPQTKSSLEAIRDFRAWGLKVIAHQIFLEGVNDSDEEINKLIEFVNYNSDVIKELRVLRYNECENSWWFESSRYNEIVDRLKKELIVKVKLQESPGKEILAACGMFHKV